MKKEELLNKLRQGTTVQFDMPKNREAALYIKMWLNSLSKFRKLLVEK